MTKRSLIIAILLVAFNFTTVKAGWYECYNYTGTINNSEVTLSFQVYEWYFGEKEKKDFNLLGIYRYDKNGAILRLEGKLDRSTNKVKLFEVADKKHTAVFDFDFSLTDSTGLRTDLTTGQKSPLNLKYISKVVDTKDADQFSGAEVLQAETLRDFYFVGVYSKNNDQERAEMNDLRIIRKKDNSLFQTLNFARADAPAGNLKTVIYDNIEPEKNSNRFLVWSNAGRMGGYFTVVYSVKKKRFVFSPKVKIDGPL